MKSEEFEQIAQNEFYLDCTKMSLSPCALGTNKKVYNGPGSIIQSQNGKISLKMYCCDKISPVEVFSRLNVQPGKIIDDSEYYDLEAIDVDGRTWKANRILPSVCANKEFTGYLVEGDFYKMISFSELPFSAKNSVTIKYRGDIRIPCNTNTRTETYIDEKKRAWSGNLNISKFEAWNLEFEIQKEKEWLIVNAVSKSNPIDYLTITRIDEALQFVLARSLKWSVIELFNEKSLITRISAAQPNETKTRIQPPFYFQTFDKTESVWKLFDKYLAYTILYREDQWHPIFSLIHSVIESGEASLEAEALTLSVSVEALLKLAFQNIALPDDTFKDEVKRVEQIVSESTISVSLKSRICGVLSTMMSPRAKDQLYCLKNKGLIEERLIEAWDKLRNKTAHGHIIELIELEEYVKLCDHVMTLFYQLIFLALNYQGDYTDYSSDGYPAKIFNVP